jgi:PAS domain S-box-containing protein
MCTTDPPRAHTTRTSGAPDRPGDARTAPSLSPVGTPEPSGSVGAPGPRRDDIDLVDRLVESTGEYAIFASDTEGCVATWNQGAVRITGYEAGEIVGRPVSCLYPEADRRSAKPDQDLAVAIADGRVLDEGWRLRADGTPFWASVETTALRGDDGRLVGFGTVIRDLTERKRGDDALRESEERYRLLVSSVADYAIFLLTPDGTVASWNLGAERLKGYRADEIVGQHFSRFYTDEDRRDGVPGQGLAKALADGHLESEGWRIRRDGSRFWANVVITALYGTDGTHRGFAKVTRDLTDRKRAEDALRGVLERERATAARLQELDQMKNELVSVIAHDLRGPVEVVESLLVLLRDDWATASEAERLELVERAATRVQAIGDFVDDVFDLARIETGELGVEPEPFDLAPVIAQVVEDVEVADPDRTVSVDAAPGAWAVGDERRTWQVLSNVVSNATKFSPPGSPLAISVEHAGAEVVVSVTDQGPGIPEDQQALLFQRFVRLPQSKGTPGSGMGLFIARSLVEAQGGRMWVTSSPGAGATFHVALPAAPT